jgi:hypothetical protein
MNLGITLLFGRVSGTEGRSMPSKFSQRKPSIVFTRFRGLFIVSPS